MGNVRSGVRDSQRSKVYTAERVVHGEMFETVEQVQTYVDRVLGRAWFKRRWPSIARHGIPVEDGRGRRAAGAKTTYRGRTITMPKWSRFEEVILHEIAHHCADVQYGTREVAAHGWQFAGTLIELVRYEMGKDEADKMKASFRKHKVRWTEPKKRKPLSEAQRAANIARLAEARANREESKPVRAIVYRPTHYDSRWRHREEVNMDRRVIVGARTKKAAAEIVGVDYAEFVRDSEWFKNGHAPEIAEACERITEGEVRCLVRQATGALNENGYPVRAWIEAEGIDRDVRDLLVTLG